MILFGKVEAVVGQGMRTGQGMPTGQPVSPRWDSDGAFPPSDTGSVYLDPVTSPSPTQLLSLGTYVQQGGCVWKTMSHLRIPCLLPGPRLRLLRVAQVRGAVSSVQQCLL